MRIAMLGHLLIPLASVTGLISPQKRVKAKLFLPFPLFVIDGPHYICKGPHPLPKPQFFTLQGEVFPFLL